MNCVILSELYVNRYNLFIESLKGQNVEGYSEVHHIVPRSMGGTNEKNNLIRLTARQHFIAHWMLWKAYGGKMTMAFHAMVYRYNKKIKRHTKINSRTHSKLVEQHSRFLSLLNTNNKYALGTKWTEESKQKMREIRAKQTIPKESYEKSSVSMSKLVWMNNGIKSCRINKSLVDEQKKNGFVEGRLVAYVTDEYRDKIKNKSKLQWQKIKESGHSNNLHSIRGK
jgi:hypothetical protein